MDQWLDNAGGWRGGGWGGGQDTTVINIFGNTQRLLSSVDSRQELVNFSAPPPTLTTTAALGSYTEARDMHSRCSSGLSHSIARPSAAQHATAQHSTAQRGAAAVSSGLSWLRYVGYMTELKRGPVVTCGTLRLSVKLEQLSVSLRECARIDESTVRECAGIDESSVYERVCGD